MGYSGGDKESPTYRSIGDHSETIQIDFDPSIITYEELLAIFWKSHSVTTSAYSRQYRSAIFYRSETQKELAEKTRAAEEQRRNATIYTAIEPDKGFTYAEDYHQKYYLRHAGDIFTKSRKIYTSEREFIDSTSAARLNGHAGGYTPTEALKDQLTSCGVPLDDVEKITE